MGQWGWCDHRPPPSPASEPHHTHAHACMQVSMRACVHAHTCGGGPHSCPAFLVQLQHPCRLPGPACLHVTSEGLCMRRAGWGPPVRQVVQAPWAMLRASYTCVRGQNKLPQSSAALSFARLGRMATHVSLAVWAAWQMSPLLSLDLSHSGPCQADMGPVQSQPLWAPPEPSGPFHSHDLPAVTLHLWPVPLFADARAQASLLAGERGSHASQFSPRRPWQPQGLTLLTPS